MNNEPVAWIYKRNDGVKFLNWKTWKDCETCNGEFIPLYTAPQGDGCGNCHACLVGVMENNMPVTSQRMIVCSDCGNKRCPKSSNHRHKCTGSNEVGQYGSIYTAPRELSEDDLWFILHCLDESVDDVHNSYLEQARLYGNMPTRKARIDGYKMSYENHLQAIKMIEDILKKASDK